MRNKMSYISYFITVFGGILVGITLIVAEVFYANIFKFSLMPLWYKILFFSFVFIQFIGLVLSFVFRRRHLMKSYEFIIEGFLMTIGLFLMCFAISDSSSLLTNLLVSIGGLLFFSNLGGLLSSTIAYCIVSDRE